MMANLPGAEAGNRHLQFCDGDRGGRFLTATIAPTSRRLSLRNLCRKPRSGQPHTARDLMSPFEAATPHRSGLVF